MIQRLQGLMVMVMVVLTLSSPAHATSHITVHRYTTEGIGSVNSYLVETPNGILLIDAQRVLSQGQAVVQAIEQLDKPLLAVLITHPHPDHVGGLAAVLAQYPDVPVYASAGTLEELTTDSNGFLAATRAVAPNDTPDPYPLPDHILSEGDSLTIDGIEVVVDELGTGEAPGMTMYFLPGQNQLFSGDLINYRMTSFLLEGRSSQWIEQLRTVAQTYSLSPPTVYPGHGEPGPLIDRLRWQLGYLLIHRYLVAQHLDQGALSEADENAIAAEVRRFFPDHPPVAQIPNLLKLNLQALAQELSQPPSR